MKPYYCSSWLGRVYAYCFYPCNVHSCLQISFFLFNIKIITVLARNFMNAIWKHEFWSFSFWIKKLLLHCITSTHNNIFEVFKIPATISERRFVIGKYLNLTSFLWSDMFRGFRLPHYHDWRIFILHVESFNLHNFHGKSYAWSFSSKEKM